MIRRFVAFGAAGLVLLAGCTSGGGGPQDPPSTLPTYSPSTPTSPSTGSTAPSVNPSTVPADVPTTGPNLHRFDEKPPKPQGVTDHTDAGAKAFAKFFYLTIDWGYATTSSAYMRHYFEKSCIECISVADGLDKTRRAGNHFIGGRLTVTNLEPAGASAKYHAEAGYFITYDITSGTAVDKDGNVKNGDVAHQGVVDEVWLAWTRGEWTVVAAGPEGQ